jgi:hypothetical protein
MSNKLWLCGQVGGSGQFDNLKDLVLLKDYFDGLCWTVNYNEEDFSDDDGTYRLLSENKKEGKILRTNWVNINSIGMTMALQCGAIKHGDWVLFIDSQELPKESFLKEVRNKILEWEANEVYSVWWGRPYLFKFFEWQTFQPTSVHTMLSPIYGKTLSIQDESKVKYDQNGVHFADFIYNKKKFENSMLLHGVKYCLFNVTNQMSMFYKDKELEQHEIARMSFCQHIEKLGYPRTLDGLEQFFKNKENISKEMIDYLNFEFVFRDFYRYKVLGHSLEEIFKDRYNYKISI